MLRIFALLLTCMTAWAVEDAWTKVRELKGGAELRVFKKGAKQPVLAKFDELTTESLVVVMKNEQVAIPRDEIERIDARPIQKGSRVTKESSATSGVSSDGGPSSSYSGGLSIGSKPNFETVYRRGPAAVQK